MVPFLASPRKGPHIQMAHYSSIWLCILHKILFQCLTTSISNTGVTIFSTRLSLSLSVFGHIFWKRITRASLRICLSSLNQYFSAVSVFLGSATFIYAKAWFLAKQLPVLPWLQLWVFFFFFWNVHLCVVRVTARKYVSGSLIETEGEISTSKQNGETSQHSQPASEAKSTSARNLDLLPNPSFISTYNLLL